MAVSTNYAVPVQVNGFTCKNCTDVDLAKKHIDPAHPKSGPYNVDAKTDPTRTTQAILYGGALSALNNPAAQSPGSSASATTPSGAGASTSSTPPTRASATGSQLDILV